MTHAPARPKTLYAVEMAVIDQRPHIIDTLRLTTAEYKELLREFRDEEARGPDRGDRAHNRFSFTEPHSIVLRVEQPGGSTIDYRVIGRNISQGGLAVFHGHLLYPNTRCTAILRMNARESISPHGTVVYCRHFRGRIHEVGIRFDQPVDITNFVEAVTAATAAPTSIRGELVAAVRDLLALVQTDAAPEKVKSAMARVSALVGGPTPTAKHPVPNDESDPLT